MEDPYQVPVSADPPALPPGPPREPNRGLWLTLLGPPGLVVVVNLLMGLVPSRGEFPVQYLLTLPIGLVAIIVGTFIFSRLMQRRHHGGNAGMAVAYFFGEIVVCLAAWFGSCVVVLGHH